MRRAADGAPQVLNVRFPPPRAITRWGRRPSAIAGAAFPDSPSLQILGHINCRGRRAFSLPNGPLLGGQ